MKLTLEPTETQDFLTVSVRSNDDHSSIGAVIDLIVALLTAWGFSKDVIRDGMEAWLGEDGE